LGYITPSINPKLHLELALKLVKKREDLTVVDTDGWLNGYGRKHKEELINLLDPDFIISMGRGVHVPPGYEERTIRLRTTPRSLFKSREKRAERRRKLFAYYFQNAEKYNVLLEGRRLGMRGSSCLPMDWLDGLLVGLENNGRIVGAGLLSVSSQSILTPCRTFDNYIMGFHSSRDGYEGKEAKPNVGEMSSPSTGNPVVRQGRKVTPDLLAMRNSW